MLMKKSGTYVSTKTMMTLKNCPFFASPVAEETAIGIVYFTTSVKCVEIGMI